MSSIAWDRFNAFFKSGNLADALAVAEREALASGDHNGFWTSQQASVLVRMGEHARAKAVAQQALVLAPRNQYALLTLGDAHLGCDEIPSALSCYREALHSDDRRIVSRGRKGVLECLGRGKEWEKLLAEIADSGSESEDLLRFKIRALQGLRRIDEAIAACEEWLKSSPDNPKALWALSECEAERDGLEATRQQYGRLAKIPTSPPVYSEIYASLCRKAGVTEAALSQYQRLSSQSGDPRVQRQQAFTLAKAGREQEAIPLMEALMRRDPKDLYMHSAYAAACKRAGLLERAWTFYHDLMSLHPSEKGLYGRIRRIGKLLEAQAQDAALLQPPDETR